jgi:CHASE3 domain sensor protein
MSIGRGEKSGSFCSLIVLYMLITLISLNKLILIRKIFIELQGQTQSLLVPKLAVIRMKIK